MNDRPALGIEITEEMLAAGEDAILSEVGGADLGGWFSAPDLAKKVFLAMVQDSGQAAPLEITDEMIRAGACVLETCGWFEPFPDIATLLAREVIEAAISVGQMKSPGADEPNRGAFPGSY